MPTQVSITEILSNALVAEIIDKMSLSDEDSATIDEEAGAVLVRAGKLQDDPTIAKINILVHPATEEFPNILYDKDKLSGYGLTHAYEIGGEVPVSYRMQRFTVELRMFFDGEFVRSIARNKAQIVLSRAHHTIMRMNRSMNALPMDSFGTKAHTVAVLDTYVREGGGEGTFIWRGNVKVEFLCSFEPVEITSP